MEPDRCALADSLSHCPDTETNHCGHANGVKHFKIDDTRRTKGSPDLTKHGDMGSGYNRGPCKEFTKEVELGEMTSYYEDKLPQAHGL